MIQGDVEYCKIWQNNVRMFGIEKMNNLQTWNLKFVRFFSPVSRFSVVSVVFLGTGLPAQCQRCRALEVLEHVDKLQSPTLSMENVAEQNNAF